jgi:hypothetical protein
MAENKKTKSFAENFKAKESGEDVIIEGWANKPVVDDVGDKMGFEKVDMKRFEKNPVMFFNHDRDLPIGKWLEWKVTPEGLWMKGMISKSTNSVVSYIRDLVKEGIIKTLSIGFDPKEEQYNRAEGYNNIASWRLNEVSVVTLPANIEAEFAMVKSLAQKHNVELSKIGAKDMDTKATDEPKKPEDESTGPAATEPAKPEDEPKKPSDEEIKTAFQDCMSAKIPKLVGEGKPQEQAIAIAMSMCRDEGKCSVDIMTKEMFDHANQVALACATDKEPKKEEPKEPETKAQPEVAPAPVSAPVSQPSDDPTNFGSPHLDLMKTEIALLGKISTQLTELNQNMLKLVVVENKPDTSDNETVTSPADNIEAQKDFELKKKICGNIDTIVKELGL